MYYLIRDRIKLESRSSLLKEDYISVGLHITGIQNIFDKILGL